MARPCPRCAEALPEAARFCPHCGASLSGAAMEERKLVTILFADITGSTTLGERFDPERWRLLLQRYFSVMAASIEAWGGTVQKFIGDAVMATFGVPIVREDDAVRALQAAHEMLERLKELNVEFEQRHGVRLQIRVGVNTGEVIAAPDQLIVTGDAVNVAARLEQMAEPGTILAGERTCAAAAGAFAFGEPQSREVRGKTAPLTVREVLHPTGTSTGRLGMQVAMVGREHEVDALASLFHEAMDQKSPRLALITGPAGIGKSRLVREVLNLASARHPTTRVLKGRCPSAGQDLTYWALGELLRGDCGIALDDPVAEARQRLRDRVEHVLQPLQASRADIDHTVFALAVTAGIRVPDNPLEQIRPVAVDNELAMAWPRFISGHASAGPVILVIEDLHWAGERLLNIIERLVARADGPILLIGTARPQFREANPSFAAGREDTAAIILRPLTRQQSGALFDEILPEHNIPESARGELVAVADGNPFFLEEIVRRLAESGALERQGDRWRITAVSLLGAMPDSVQAVLAARIDALPTGLKRALQEAAVIGRTFWEGPVRRATGDAELTATLLALEAKGLVAVRPISTIAGELEYTFKHALVRDVAYASLPQVRRARAHAEAANWLERMAGDRAEELSELIAHHYRNALFGEAAELAWGEDPAGREAVREKAFAALLRAGATARTRFAITLALELHQDAVRLSRGDRERRLALEAIGDDHEGAFHGDDAVAAWEEALTLLGDDAGHREERIRLLAKCAKMTAIRWGGFKVVPPTRQVDGYINAALARDPQPRDRGWLLGLRAYCNTRKGDPAEIEAIPLSERKRAGEEASRIGRELADVDLQVLAIRALSGIAITEGDYRRAAELTDEEASIMERIAASRDRALSMTFVALRLMDLEGRYADGLEVSRRNYALSKELSMHEVMHALYLLLYGNASLGRWDAVKEILEEVLEGFRVDHDMACPYVRSGPMVCAAVLARLGELERAREVAALVPMDWDAPALPEALHGIALLQCGDAAAARDEAERILKTHRRLTYEEAPFEVVLMLDTLVALEDREGLAAFLPTAERKRHALAVLPPACDRAAGVLLVWEGKPDEAQALLDRAIAGYERLGQTFEAERTRVYLARKTSV